MQIYYENKVANMRSYAIFFRTSSNDKDNSYGTMELVNFDNLLI